VPTAAARRLQEAVPQYMKALQLAQETGDIKRQVCGLARLDSHIHGGTAKQGERTALKWRCSEAMATSKCLLFADKCLRGRAGMLPQDREDG
jgi:hypothetical protein